jgi:hypothetical protein
MLFLIFITTIKENIIEVIKENKKNIKENFIMISDTFYVFRNKKTHELLTIYHEHTRSILKAECHYNEDYAWELKERFDKLDEYDVVKATLTCTLEKCE